MEMVNISFWIEFIDLFRSLPVLWQIRSNAYKNKSIRTEAYKKLLEKLKELDSEATMDQVRKSIRYFKTTYRRENKKIMESHNTAQTAQDIYTPILWCYDHLCFLDAADQQLQENSRIELCEENSLPIFKEHVTTKKKSKTNSINEQNNILRRLTDELISIRQPQDEASILSASWQAKYRSLNPEQKIYASNCIEMALHLGALGELNTESYKNLQPQIMQHPFATLHQQIYSPAPDSSGAYSLVHERLFNYNPNKYQQ